MDLTKLSIVILGVTINFGPGGNYGPGREKALIEYLQSRADGVKTLQSLLDRKFVKTSAAQPEQSKVLIADDVMRVSAIGKKRKKGRPKKSGSQQPPKAPEPAPTTTKASGIYESTGRWEIDHYGGGMCHIIDPDGNVVEQKKGVKNAEAYVLGLNKKLEEAQ